MKVYVVTEGDYSDYHIIGVTTDRKKAKQYCELTKGRWYEPQIELYETDSFTPDITAYKVYDVGVYANGNVFTKEIDKPDGYDYEMAMMHDVSYSRYGDPFRYKVTLMAIDKEHAEKIGCDYIAEYKYRYKCEGALIDE